MMFPWGKRAVIMHNRKDGFIEIIARFAGRWNVRTVWRIDDGGNIGG